MATKVVKKKKPPTHVKARGRYEHVVTPKLNPFGAGSDVVNSGHRSKDKRPQGAGLGLGYPVEGEHY